MPVGTHIVNTHISAIFSLHSATRWIIDLIVNIAVGIYTRHYENLPVIYKVGYGLVGSIVLGKVLGKEDQACS